LLRAGGGCFDEAEKVVWPPRERNKSRSIERRFKGRSKETSIEGKGRVGSSQKRRGRRSLRKKKNGLLSAQN